KVEFAPLPVALYPLRVELAERLKSIAPGVLKNGKVAYCNTGSEAAALPMKLAMFTTKRHAFIACSGAYHGSSMGGLSISVGSSDFRKGYSPFLPGVFAISYPDPYRCPHIEENGGRCAEYKDQMNQLFDNLVSSDEIAA